MLTSVDLFTGIGGFVLALKGICKPIIYCDIDPNVRTALKSMISTRKLPTAVILDDVRNTSAIVKTVGTKTVDVITAGFPCVGFSSVGNQAGLGDNRSALFHDAVKVVRKLKPTIVFLENVPDILSTNGGQDIRTVVKAMHFAGYDCRWTVCSANDVGLPQSRKRWFCLCVKRGAMVPTIDFSSRSRTVVRPPLLVTRAADYKSRYFMLGNAIVPLAARTALHRLWTGFEVGRHLDKAAFQSNVPEGKSTTHGFSVKGKLHLAFFPSIAKPVETIVIDPEHYRPDYVAPKFKHRAEKIVGKHVLHNWPTPRATAPRHSNALSRRNIRDLPTIALFAADVNGVKQPLPVQGMTVNPQFLEWLMGFPKDHTKVLQ
jgi:DNA-cytosine methyltransferase